MDLREIQTCELMQQRTSVEVHRIGLPSATSRIGQRLLRLRFVGNQGRQGLLNLRITFPYSAWYESYNSKPWVSAKTCSGW